MDGQTDRDLVEGIFSEVLTSEDAELTSDPVEVDAAETPEATDEVVEDQPLDPEADEAEDKSKDEADADADAESDASGKDEPVDEDKLWDGRNMDEMPEAARPALRQYVRQFNEAKREVADLRKQVESDPVRSLIQERADAFAALNTDKTPEEVSAIAVQEFLALRQDPDYLIRHYEGVREHLLASGLIEADGAAQEPAPGLDELDFDPEVDDPRLGAALQALEQVQSRLDQFEQGVQNQTQEQQIAALTEQRSTQFETLLSRAQSEYPDISDEEWYEIAEAGVQSGDFEARADRLQARYTQVAERRLAAQMQALNTTAQAAQVVPTKGQSAQITVDPAEMTKEQRRQAVADLIAAAQ